MLLQIVISVLILLLTHFYYSKVHLPKKKMLSYKRLFQQAGFKVKLQPYKLLGAKAIDHIVESQQNFNNPMHFHQRELPQYDVAVGSCAMQPFIQLINLDLIQAYFNTNSYSYNKFEPIIANLRRVVGSGIAFSEGNEWKKKRKVISNVFHFEFLHSLIPKMIKTLDEYFEEFDERTEKKVVLLDMFQDLLATFMIKFFFGTELKGQTLDGVAIPLFITKLMFDVNEQGFEPVALALGPKFLKLGLRVKDRDINRRVKLFRDYALKTIDDRVKELKEKGFKEGDKKTGDLIQELYLSNTLKEKVKTDDIYDYLELVEEFCTFFVAGTDTTSHLLTMTMVYLARHPQTKKNLVDQMNEIIKTEQDINSQNFKKLPYMTAVFNQTGRVYGPGTGLFIRQVITPHQLKGVPLSADTLVAPEFCPNNHNPLYYKDPHQFIPQRWLNENKTLPHPFLFTPFSSGARNCIGQHLAQMEAKVVLIKLLKRYDFEIKNPKDIKLKFGFLVTPEPFETVLIKREEVK